MDLASDSPSSYCLGTSIINTSNNSNGDSCSTKLHHADCMINGATSSSSSSSSINTSGCNLSNLNGTGGGGGGLGGGGGSNCMLSSATSLPTSTSPCPGIISDLLLHSDLDIAHNISNTNNSASSSPFNYDPFDGFPFLDTQHCMQPLFDHFVGSDLGTDCDAGYNSGVDLFANNSIVCDRSDSVTSEPYSVVDIACHTIAAAAAASATSNNNNISIMPDSLIYTTTEHNNINGSGLNIHSAHSCFNHSETTRCTSLGSLNDSINDIHNNINNNSNQLDNYRNYIHSTNSNNNNNNNIDDHPINSNSTYTSNNNNFSNYNDCQLNYQTCPATGKRSVLMNLLIDGSDVGAGYTSHNCRALPQRITTQKIEDLS